MSKPYAFIPQLPPKEYTSKEVVDKPVSGKMTLEITAIKPIFISDDTFSKSEEKDELVKKFTRYKGKVVIPGSSLKGTVRSIAEIVSYSCQHQNCNCISCLTFGKLGFKGRTSFGDFLLKEGKTETMYIPQLMSPKKNEKGVKFYFHGNENVLEKGPIAVEAVMPGSKFVGDIFFRDLKEEQLELVCFSIGLDKTFHLKLGYNKPGYFGSCKIDVLYAVKGEEGFKPEDYAKAWGKNYTKKEQLEIENNKKLLRNILGFSNARSQSDWVERSGIRTY